MEPTHASLLQVLGAFCFGAVIGWFTYFTNRYRREVSLTDIATIIGALGGAAILALFRPRTDLFGAYGFGLAVGFFGYFIVLLLMVAQSETHNVDWFLDPTVPSMPQHPMAMDPKAPQVEADHPESAQ